MDDTKALSEKWKQIKEEESEEYKKYVNMAEEKDKENGLEPSGSKNSSQTMEKKLTMQLIKERTEGTEDENKPIFVGKKIDSPTNNYKEWKKAQLGIPPESSIPRADYNKYKEEDNFDQKNMDGMDWDNYIRDNMAFVEDI